MEVQMVTQMLEELVLAAVDQGNQKDLGEVDGHPEEDFSDFYLDKEALLGDLRRPRVESGFHDGSDDSAKESACKLPEKKHLDSGTGSFCSNCSCSSSTKSVAGSDREKDEHECDLEFEDVSDGSFSEVFWSSSPQTEVKEPKPQRLRLQASSIDQEESDSNIFDPWPISHKTVDFPPPPPRTPLGLLDLSVISPCTPAEPCLLDRMILQDFYARGGSAGRFLRDGKAFTFEGMLTQPTV